MLPNGEPPAGEIVRQNGGDPLSEKGAEERLITALTLIGMTEIPGQAVSLKAPEKMQPILKRVLQAVSAASGIKYVNSLARFTLQCVDKEGDLRHFSLVDNLNQKILWQDEFRIVVKNAD